ncbi:hypothetical protein Scep_027403 [Stephania cephalantha]|uniref:Chromo domain-containing protein n=1 Tax=Stephania cephalantha TaxID=152367 RepID=A0AAP0HL20_9MAGN
MLRLAESKAGVRPTVDLSQIDLSEDISYEEHPIQILDRKVQQLRSKSIPKVLVKWQFHDDTELTREREDYMRDRFPYLFEAGRTVT